MGLYNRVYYVEKINDLERNISSYQSLCCIVIDINDFKSVNDRFGHYIGDETLRQVSQTIQEAFNDTTPYVFRVGGDEFFVVLINVSEAFAQKKLEEFLGAKVDEQRLLTELAILLERGDIHEELDRLAIHVQKLDELIEAQCPVGRELDFLIQEMNREINTIGSKSNAIEIKNQVVQSKTILEKIREQVQNIE